MEERKLQAKNTEKWGRKHKVDEVTSESDDSASEAGSNPTVSLDILDSSGVQ